MEDVRLIISSLWAAVTFCLVFAAILGNFKPGTLQGIMAGEVDGIKITQNMLSGNALMMATPSVMTFLSLALPFPAIRWVNIILGVFFVGVIALTLAYYQMYEVQTWTYYYIFTVTEIVLYALIVWNAWKWG